ncbi:MAG TPA: serine/threonine-protein kinase [Rhizomicrobium sp.]|jgi:tRNA A-37 threonylcarbamoyl transferase component Bud32
MGAPYHNKALPEGSILREWRLEEVLGVGGFGIVYRGKNIHFGESVAIKEYFPGAISDRVDGTTVAPTDSSSEEIYQLGRQKFIEEAKILWNLSQPQRHPNLVSVRSLFEIHGTAYMVMDFESGISLSQLLHEGKTFDEAGLLAIIKPIATGLERAHQAGVLHRDIKPANILINRDGRAVLIDFGSARFETGNATNTKVTFYTPPYAALEQYVKSFPQGPWTDIYALGVVLYQCVTGQKPPEVLERMHGEDSAVLSTREWPGFSRVFTKAVDAAMKVRPMERPSSISAWLKMFDGEEPEPAPIDDPTRIAAAMASLPAFAQAPVPAPVPATGTAKPKAAPVPATAAAKPKAAAAKPKGKRNLPMMVLAVGAGVIVLAALVSFVLHRAPEPATTQAPATAAAPAAAAAPTVLGKMDALIDAAKTAGRPDAEITTLAAARTELAGLAAKGDSAEQGTVAAAMAKAEARVLARAEKRAWRAVDPSADPSNAMPDNDAARQLQTGKSDLDAKLALTAQDAGQSIDNTRGAIVAFATFKQDMEVAKPAYIAAKRKAFDAALTATKAVIDQVVSLAAVEKPWFLASQARKDAYKLRQDNATQAKAMSSQLDTLAQHVATANDLDDLSTAVAQAKATNQSVNALYAASYAAKL